ncbi:hypothetical protein H2198_003474 [Neophaeococcomyces mojaviensis]|uniref:Uncharacterized protein n=1 Tax=Neophaeococcomyces mojaviensis TaxID=3383035 RepID=A0ACC3ABT6_9EURO|nr:hypothetical protein H2198_003474 [Knufia sp. JES_112]
MGDHNVSKIIVESIYNAGVRVVFGIPGAKIDSIFDTLSDHPEIKLIVCRHEQNAAMMAAAHGRITGIPGVCIATSGPGASNLATGLVTATTEGDPVVALIGSVPRNMNTHRTHQSMKALEILGPTSKAAISIDVEDQAAEVILSAFRAANSYPKGAAVVSLPQDVAKANSKFPAFEAQAFISPRFGTAAPEQAQKVLEMIKSAKMPVLFLGARASSPIVVNAVRNLLSKFPIPTVETFQAAGAVSKELVHLFYGRVGLFRNQAGDKLLSKSDLILAVGYDPVEYDTFIWNPTGARRIVHIDYQPSDYGVTYHPIAELLGSVAENLNFLANNIASGAVKDQTDFLQNLTKEYYSWQSLPTASRFTEDKPVHPLTFITELQKRLSKDTTVSVDVGTVYIYMMRCFFAYEPRRLLCSDGQQTLGVGLPFAIAASLTQDPPCSQKVVSMSGDGGFMFSSNELVTAVQQKCNITHFIWNDSSYNMVEFQEEMKYGRSSGVKLGGIDFAKYAESFGARGYRVENGAELTKIMDEALGFEGVSLVDVRIDYSEAGKLAGDVIAEGWN